MARLVFTDNFKSDIFHKVENWKILSARAPIMQRSKARVKDHTCCESPEIEENSKITEMEENSEITEIEPKTEIVENPGDDDLPLTKARFQRNFKIYKEIITVIS